MKCKHCGKEITRKRGNLTLPGALQRAIQALLERHERKCGSKP